MRESVTAIAIVDAGPLYAAVDLDDRAHERCVEVLQQPGLRLVLPVLAVAEVSYMLGRRLGPSVEAAFARGLREMDVEPPALDDWNRIAQLVEQYGDFPLGTADASAIALAERLDTDLVITLDRRHFGAVRPRHCPAFRLLPE